MLDYRMDTFLTLCRLLNYRETAAVLNITQPAVTQHIQFLEREYGCKLFTYKNRHLAMTQAGRLLEEYICSTLHNEKDMRRKITGEGLQELRLGATKTIGDYVLNQKMLDFVRKPDNGLTMVVDNTQNLLAMLEDNKLDFLVLEGYFDKQHYGWQLYRREPFVGICHKDHPFCGREVDISELMKEAIVHREQGSGTRAILERKLAGENESLAGFRRRINISSFKLILETVRAGLGISFVYKVLADSDPELGQFCLKGEPMVREFNIVYLKHTDHTEMIRRFFGDELPGV